MSPNSSNKISYIYKHCSENSHLHVWLDNFQIVYRNHSNRINELNKQYKLKAIVEQAR